MSTQMHDKVLWWEVTWPPGLSREKKQRKSQVQLNLNVSNDVDNRERANKKKNNGDKFCWKKKMKTGGKK